MLTIPSLRLARNLYGRIVFVLKRVDVGKEEGNLV